MRLLYIISRTLVGGVLPICRYAVGVFYSPRRLGRLFGVGSYPSADVQSVYSTAPVDLASSLEWGLIFLLRCSRCILQPQLTGLFSEVIFFIQKFLIQILKKRPNDLNKRMSRHLDYRLDFILPS